MRVAIHQPEYLPPLSLLDKARRADVLVLLDDVQFNRESLQHRAKIAPRPRLEHLPACHDIGRVRCAPRCPLARKDSQFTWLTIPFVHAHPQLIRDVQVADPGWAGRHVGAVHAVYVERPGFAAAWPALKALWASPSAAVAEIAAASMRILFQAFGVQPGQVVTATELAAEGKKGDRVLSLCQRLGASCYLSGASGATYLDRAAFHAAGVAIEVQAFHPPAGLAQEVKGLSALDAWMRLGDRAKEVFG